MRSFDFTPVFRSTIGFDRMMQLVDSALRESVAQAPAYPPYNIEKLGEDSYRITMAVAGFGPGDIDVTVEDRQLLVRGKIEAKEEDKAVYLYRGIAGRAFERRFDLADHIKVVAASMENGLLHIELAREVPEALKPRKIEVAAAGSATKAIERKAA